MMRCLFVVVAVVTPLFWNDPQYIDGELSVQLMCFVAVWLLFNCLVWFLLCHVSINTY